MFACDFRARTPFVLHAFSAFIHACQTMRILLFPQPAILFFDAKILFPTRNIIFGGIYHYTEYRDWADSHSRWEICANLRREIIFHTSERFFGSNKENARGPPLPGKCVRGAPGRSLYLNRFFSTFFVPPFNGIKASLRYT